MSYNFIKWATLKEDSAPKTLELLKLTYDRNDLKPALSEDVIDYHYEKLAKGYVDRFNRGEGDPKFNEAGAFLHNILFAQYQSYTRTSTPSEQIEEFIKDHFKSFAAFKEEFLNVAMSIQGSGWVYLAKDGKIKTIVNHEIKKDIVLLIDWWEHAMYDYKWDKKSYLTNQWKIIDWSVISSKL